MLTITAHFDGTNIVPERPLDLPRNARLSVQIEDISLRSGNEVAKWKPLDIHIDPQLGQAIATDPDFDIQES